MALYQSTAPTEEPVSLEEAKDHLRVSTDTEDATIEAAIVAAREYCEAVTRRQFVTATYKLTLDSWPSVIRPPRPPLVSVTSIGYTDTNGDAQTFSSSNYTVDTYSEPGRIALAYGQSWPDVQSGIIAPITVTYVAGYGAATAVPRSIKAAMLLCIADLYEHREAMSEIRLEENPTVDRLLWSKRMLEI